MAALVLMVLEALLGHDIGSDHYVNVRKDVGSSIGDHGIGRNVNTGNTNVMAGCLQSPARWRVIWNRREKERPSIFSRFLSFINGGAIFSEKILDKKQCKGG